MVVERLQGKLPSYRREGSSCLHHMGVQRASEVVEGVGADVDVVDSVSNALVGRRVGVVAYHLPAAVGQTWEQRAWR